MEDATDSKSLWNELGPSETEQSKDQEKGENVQVVVRCRPPIKDSLSRVNCVNIDEIQRCVDVEGRLFYFDSVFGPQATNDTVYMKSVRQLVESAFRGYNCTIFLYGQTGTGKTYTHSSLTLSTFKHLFTLIQDSDNQARFLIRASYYELYNENIRDLLVSTNQTGNKALELRESKSRGVYIKDLTTYLVNNLAELEKLKRLGDKQRVVASTKMNQQSSRSHSIFSITIEAVDTGNNTDNVTGRQVKNAPSAHRGSSASARNSMSQTVRVGRLNLIDLAGSERQSKSGSSGARLKEASRINLSLTCLSLVIRALTDPSSSHIPYRNSKLTRLLSNSLGGNAKTLVIACISGDKTSLDETLNTLRFAQRTKKVKNEAKINEDPKDALLRKYRSQIEELKLRLQSKLNIKTGKQTHDLKSNQDSAGVNIQDDYDDVDDDDRAIGMLNPNMDQNSSNKDDNDAIANTTGDNKERDELLQQLRLLKNKIMIGGVNLLEKAEMHERLLEASRQELEEKRQRELNLKNELDKKQKYIDSMAKSKGTLEDQVIVLDDKLKRVLTMYHQTKEEQRDLSNEHEQLKENLLKTIRATNKEIKYANCIIDDFIPGEYRNFLLSISISKNYIDLMNLR